MNFLTCPLPEVERSRSAAIIPMAQTKLPPAKSANRLMGGSGFSPFRPRLLRTPESAR